MKYIDIIKKMTLDEKASLLSGKDFWHTHSVDRLNIPNMALADGPHGLRKQADEGDHLGLVEGVKATCFPTSATISNSWDVSLGVKIGVGLGEEAVSEKVNVILGPGLNIKRNPLCGRNFEYFSEDPYLSGKMASGYIKGIQSCGISACPKHFAANNQEYLRMTSDSIIDDRTLHEIYLTGFEIAVKEGQPLSIMSSYNKVNGAYANENKYLLRDVLVDNWGFKGIVVSDWGGSNNHVEGVKVGAHLEMPSTGGESKYQLIQAVQKGVIDEIVVDERVEDYLDVLFKTTIKEELPANYKKNNDLARYAAEQSAVLLKNENILPVLPGTKVAIIGDFAKNPRYQGAGSSLVNPYYLESTLSIISNYEFELIGFSKGYERNGKINPKLIEEATTIASKADIVLVYIGLNEVNEVEGHDRTRLKLPENQISLVEALAKTNSNLVGIISAGSVIEMPFEEHFKGLIHGYLSGQAGASALLNIITGKVNPSGKLSESYPIVYADCSNKNYYPGKEKTSEYREGLFIGYRYYDTANVQVRYPFGYGLSYTTFEYSDLEIYDQNIRFKLKNIGNVAGSEVVQLYLARQSDTIYRPKKELKGFEKIHLEPGETKDVELLFDEYTFRYYDTEARKFQVEAGKYQIMIGASSKDIRLVGDTLRDGVTIAKVPKDTMKKYFTGDVMNITDVEFEELYGRNLPQAKWQLSNPLELNDSILQMVYAKSRSARLVIKILLKMKARSFRKGKPDLNILFLSSMPFRGIAKMTNGAVSMEMVEDILTIVNGKFMKGIRSFLNHQKELKKRRKL
ncbi:MAG: glycoside hydrolase family 3 C-terminal domain-containing protein [Mobilitalea sp.]